MVYGLTTSATTRCASTWSGPFWASSSITKMAVVGQNFDFDTPSTSIPSAMSLSTTCAVGVGLPTRVPDVWSFGNRTICSRGMSPPFSNRASSLKNRSARFTSG